MTNPETLEDELVSALARRAKTVIVEPCDPSALRARPFTAVGGGELVESVTDADLPPQRDAVELIGTTSSPSSTEIVEHASRTDRPRFLAAAAVILMVLGGLFTLQTLIRTDSPVQAIAEGPATAPLFVLPDPLVDGTVSNGEIDETEWREAVAANSENPIVGGMIGQPIDGGYANTTQILILSNPDDFVKTGQYQQIGTTSMYRSPGDRDGENVLDDNTESVLEIRGDIAVLLTRFSGRLDDPTPIFDQITTRSDRTFSFSNNQEYALIDQWILDKEADRLFTTLAFTHENNTFRVETLEVPIALYLGAGDRLQEISIKEVDGWLIESDERIIGVAWSVTQTQMVFVGGFGDARFAVHELIEAAGMLEIVDRETWFAAFPTLEDTTE